MVVESRCRRTDPLRDRVCLWAWFRDVERRLMISYEVWNLSQDRRLRETPHEILRCIRA